MHPILIDYPFPIYSFGVFVVLGVIGGLFVARNGVRSARLDEGMFWDVSLTALLVGVVVSRLWHVAFAERGSVALTSVFTLSGTSLSLLGGLLAGGAVVVYLLRRRSQSLTQWLDAVSPGILVALAIGTIGSVLGGIMIGSTTRLPWAIEVGADLRHPIAEYYLVGYLLLLVVGRHYIRRHQAYFAQTGNRWWSLVAGVALLHVVVEPWRDPLTSAFIRGVRIEWLIWLLLATGALIRLRLGKESRETV